MSVTAPKGFRAAGVAAGLKASGPDVALVVNDGPDATAAGVFAANRGKAAPVLWTEQVLRGGIVRAVVLNSGGANAGTGPAGFQDTHRSAEHTAAVLRGPGVMRAMVGASDVAVCSTGPSGDRLPMDRLLRGVEAAGRRLARDGGPAAAEALLTTGSRSRQAVQARAGWSVGGMATGSGRFGAAAGAGALPATGTAAALCVLTTDAVTGREDLDAALRAACLATFDRVDGGASGDHTVLLLASGASGVQPTVEELTGAVTAVCADLAYAPTIPAYAS